MNIGGFSDLARSVLAQSQQKALKTEQTNLSTELSTGLTSDPVKHLRAEMTILADMTQKRDLAEQYLQSNRETKLLADVSQNALSTIQGTTESFVGSLMIGSQTESPGAVDRVANEAEAAFATIVNMLNSAVAGRYAFSGQASDQQPLLSPEDFRSVVDTTLAGATDAAEVQSRLDDFFSAGGGFETAVYMGSTVSMAAVTTSETSSVQLDLRADDPLFRDGLKSALMGIAASQVPGLPQADQDALISAALGVAVTAKDNVVDAAGALGFTQERLERSQAQVQAQISAADLVRTELLSADPYETASKLEDVNTRLEFLYTVTARARNLSFLEYMR